MRLHDAAPRSAQCLVLLLMSIAFASACSSPMQQDGSSSGDASDIVVGSDIGSDARGDVNTGACVGDLDCNDMVFCNGAERCMPGAVGADGRGCVAAPSQNACLAGQTCNETEQRCVTQCMHALDADGDGHRAVDCGGDDCADDDPNRFPGNPEVCDAMDHDEDCDAMTFGLRDTDSDSFVDARCCNVESGGTRHCGDDCNDSRPNVHPGLAEACDGLDNSCDTRIDEDVQRTFHPDMDDDGYGVSTGTTMMGCNPPAHYAENTGDCDDANSAVHPGALEQCDGAMVDENCDGTANPAALCTCSGDISRACATAAGACAAGSQRCIGGSWGACSITPVPETCNGIDDDCDGMTDEMLFVTCYPDADNDGYPAAGVGSVQSCPVPGRDAFAGCPANQTNRAPSGIDIDCNDSDSTISPGQPELCDSTMRDENCDGAINPASLCMCADGQTRPCTAPGTCGAGNQTCSAGRFSACSVNPVAESCNAIDDDCDGMTDEGLTVTCYVDRDNDGYAAMGTAAIQSCPVMGRDFVGGCPTNQTNRAPASGVTDCNDMNAAISPAASELCDSTMVDENCDGMANPSATCACSGTASRSCTLPGACAAGTQTCSSGSWGNCSIAPIAESCNSVDDDCDGMTDEGTTITCYPDADNDGYAPTGATSSQTCSVTGRESVGGCPAGHTNRAPTSGNTDCNDSASSVNPGAPEQCDAAMADENCDGTANPSSLCMCSGTMTRSCTLPGACAAGTQACQSGSWGTCSIGPVPETCNGTDDNCNGMTDEGVTITCYPDADNDGYAATGATPQQVCAVPGRSAVGGCATNFTNRAPSGASNIDCNDSNGSVNPAASEQCDAAMADENCDGTANPASLCACSGAATRSCSMGGLAGPCASGTQMCSGGSWQACTIQPQAETCNAIDDDCDGMTDESLTVACYLDADNDGYAATGAASSQQCPIAGREVVGGCPTGYTNRAPTGTAIDCDAMNSSINPAAAEVCDAAMVDENCDGMANPASACMCSGSATRACPQPGVCGTGTQTCSGGAWGGCSVTATTEVCNGLDDDCDGMTDESGSGGSLTITCYLDADSDGYGAPGALQRCPDASRTSAPFNGCPVGYTANSTDCNDASALVRPTAMEVCNGIDDNCNSSIDESVTTAFYRDADGDGFGAGTATNACTAPSGYVANNTDCNDSCASCRPGGTEVCDTFDNNCNGSVDEGTTVTCYADGDNDTYALMGTSASTRCPDTSRPLAGNCPAGSTSRQPATAATSDCADTTAARNPGVLETCNGIDDDCDGVVDDGVTVQCYADTDNDTYAASAAAPSAQCPDSSRGNVGGCPVGFTNRPPAAGAIDCAPTNAMINPSAVEVCNGIDDNCVGGADEGAGIRFYQDNDHDGFGNPSVSQVACAAPANYVSDSTDCGGDSNPLVHPGATEICNGIDDNCAGGIDEAGAVASCGSVANTTFTCTGGSCVPTCTAPWANCDGDATNGCEANLNTDGQHCGTCTHTCGVGSACLGSSTCDQPSMVAAGGQYTCVLRSSGRLVCFGDNSQGQFGTGDMVSSTSPVWVPDISGATRVAAAGDQNFAIYGQHTCVTIGGSMLCTGRNNHAQLGNGTFATPSLRFTGASTCGASVCGSSGNVSLGASHSCARNSSGIAGEIYCWGYGGDGEIGDGGYADRPYPVAIFTTGAADVAAGPASTCAVVSGSVRCWGSNLNGLCGDGSSTSGTYNSPNTVCNSSGASCTLLSSIAGVEVGYAHACAYETAVGGGDVWCWGGNVDLQRGDTTAGNRAYAAIVPGTSGTTDLVLGTFHTCALRSGGVWCWGVGSARGDGLSGNTATPVQVRINSTTLLTGVTQISAGAGHTCALTGSGDVYCWGDNSDGQLGLGNMTNQVYATRIVTLRQ